MSNTQRIYPTFSALLALSACLVVVWCRKSPDSAGNVGEKNGIATVTANEKPTSNLQAEFTSAVNKIVSRSRQTNRASESIQPVVQSSPLSVESSIAEFTERQTSSAADAAQYASDMNDVMDEMLNRSEIPADYAETMVALFSDKSRGDVIRDFAVQHIGLYAETLNMRGKYNADSSESATLRAALWDAAFRALADMAEFDPHIDASRLDSRLAACVTDASASPAARVMAAQLCGERGIVAAKSVLAAIAADRRESEPLRLAAANSARLLAE